MRLERNQRYDGANEFRTLSTANAQQILSAVERNAQGQGHRQFVSECFMGEVEAEVMQQTPEYAILHITRWSGMPYLVGYSDEQRMFIHALPKGQFAYDSEKMSDILRFINRIEDGYQRVQGDLLVRVIKDGAEIEELRMIEKETPLDENKHEVGNSHKIEGKIIDVAGTTVEPRVVTKTSKTDGTTEIRHVEHGQIMTKTNREQYNEISLQRRGQEFNNLD